MRGKAGPPALGTAHVVTNSAGTILDDSDFYPFGGERVVTSSSGNNYKFTGKERDTESGLDNFGARYYASTTGRFLSPDDTKYASLADPQTWNLYSYVSNHPLTMTDPTGHSADPWAASLRGAEYNSFTEEMQGGGVGSVLGGDSGGADGDMSGATSDGSESVQHQNEQNNVVYEPSQFSGIMDYRNSDTDPEPDAGQSSTAASQQQQNYGRQSDGSYRADPAQVSKTINSKDNKPIGDGQCVSACSAFSGVTPHTDSWTPGRSMADLKDTKEDLGLAVATFGSDGKYKQRDGDQNSAIYMGHDKYGRIQVVDQWPYNADHHSPFLHPIGNYGPSGTDSQGHYHSNENNAYYYHVIIVK